MYLKLKIAENTKNYKAFNMKSQMTNLIENYKRLTAKQKKRYKELATNLNERNVREFIGNKENANTRYYLKYNKLPQLEKPQLENNEDDVVDDDDEDDEDEDEIRSKRKKKKIIIDD